MSRNVFTMFSLRFAFTIFSIITNFFIFVLDAKEEEASTSIVLYACANRGSYRLSPIQLCWGLSGRSRLLDRFN